jgi:hypothetical protein
MHGIDSGVQLVLPVTSKHNCKLHIKKIVNQTIHNLRNGKTVIHQSIKRLILSVTRDLRSEDKGGFGIICSLAVVILLQQKILALGPQT